MAGMGWRAPEQPNCYLINTAIPRRREIIWPCSSKKLITGHVIIVAQLITNIDCQNMACL